MATEEDLEELEWEAAVDKAEVCVFGGLQPSEYDALTDLERAAFVEVINRQHS